jgi:hypothetical protein
MSSDPRPGSPEVDLCGFTDLVHWSISRIRDAGPNFVLSVLYGICKKALKQHPHNVIALYTQTLKPIHVVNQFHFRFVYIYLCQINSAD